MHIHMRNGLFRAADPTTGHDGDGRRGVERADCRGRASPGARRAASHTNVDSLPAE
jgi:hypothetical protein